MKHLTLESYIPLIDFLSLYLGNESEIILCDTKQIIYIANAFDPSQVPGSPLGEMQEAFITNPDCQDIPYTMNYRALSPKQEKLRSATFFLRDGKKLAGLLTINTKVTKLLQIRDTLESLINGYSSESSVTPFSQIKPPEYYETLSLSVSEIIDSIIADSRSVYGANPERFTTEEKLEIMRIMDSKGVFLVKGSVTEVAKKLKSSEATIYRYLQQINK